MQRDYWPWAQRLMASVGLLYGAALTNFQNAGGNAAALVIAIGVLLAVQLSSLLLPALTAGAVGMLAFG